MPKRKAKGRSAGSHGQKKRTERAAKAAARRERKSGLYLSPGDADFKKLSDQLKLQGLALRDVPGDGNCLFRAFAAQLSDDHKTLRHKAVTHIQANAADYAPFVEDGTSFDSYVKELSEDGTYAVIHQLDAPRWEVHNPIEGKTIHIAYLRGEHYCSVVPLHSDPTLPELEAGQPVKLAKPPKPRSPKRDQYMVEQVLEATGCQDRTLAEQCLRENSGEVELAIVELLQLMSLADDAGCMQQVEVIEQPVTQPKVTSAARKSHPPTGGPPRETSRDSLPSTTLI